MPPSNQTPSARSPRGSVLVTGGAGFVGAALARRLVASGRRVTVLDDLSGGDPARLPAAGDEGHDRLRFVRGDAGDPAVLRALLEPSGDGAAPCGHLIHFAAVVGVRRVLADPAGCRRAHERLTDAVATALAALDADRRPRLYAASTSEVYAESPAHLSEDGALRPLDGSGRWSYAATKRAAEERFDALRELWPAGRAPVHLRFFNVVGPGQDADSGMVLPRFVERARAGLPLEVHGDGEQERTFAHVDEVARCLHEMLDRDASVGAGVPGGAWNVGGAARTTIGALARLVADRAGTGARVVHVDPRRAIGPRFEDVRRRVPDLSRLAALGVTVPSRSLKAIVDDCLARHPERTAAGAGRTACASPAS